MVFDLRGLQRARYGKIIFKEWLDKGSSNADWKLLFLVTEMHHLPRVKSDHCPILLITDPLAPKSPKPFRFEQMWLTNPNSLPLWRIARKNPKHSFLPPPPCLGSLNALIS